MPRKLIDRVLVIDVEATCYAQKPPPGEDNEIIEVGWCMVRLSDFIKHRGTMIVKPTISKVSEFCTNLTTLTQAQVDQGISFADACMRVRDMGSRNIPWASYGDYDRKMFMRQCEREHVEYPFGPRHINIKTLAMLGLGLNKERGTEEMLKRLGIGEFEGTHHRGGDDAHNVAKILVEILETLRIHLGSDEICDNDGDEGVHEACINCSHQGYGSAMCNNEGLLPGSACKNWSFGQGR